MDRVMHGIPVLDPAPSAPEWEDVGITLRRLVAPLMNRCPDDEITPADVEEYRNKNVYTNTKMKLDLRTEYGGFLHQGALCLTDNQIEALRKETDEFISHLR